MTILPAVRRLVRVAALVWLAGPATALAGDAARPRLCIEYLPGIVYEDESITVCVRVEAGGEEPTAFRLTTWLLDEETYILDKGVADGTAAPGAPWRYHGSLSPGEWTPATLWVELSPPGGDVVASLMVRVLSGRETLPALRVEGMRLVDGEGHRVIARIEHRVYEPEQRWPLVRWLQQQLVGEGWAFRRALVLGDDLGAPSDGYLSALAAASEVETAVVPVSSSPDAAGPPILRAVAALTSAQLDAEPEVAVLCLGNCDSDFGTDVIEFGRALELILQQLEARGCSQVILVAPVGPSTHRKRLARYARAARQVAYTYRARFLDVADDLADEHWAAGSDGQVLLRLPNPDGQAALAEAIATYLSKLRR
jgi:hypothetical protein